MFQYLISLAKGSGALNSQLGYVSNRMDSILELIITNDVYDTILALMSQIGIALLLTYFLVDLLEKASDVQFTLDIFGKQFIKFIIGFVIMSHIPELLIFFKDFSMTLTAALASFGDGSGWAATISEVNDGLERISTSSSMDMTDAGGLKDLIFAVGFQLVLQFTTWKLSIERALRIAYKSLLAPIACADMITNGMASNGIRYLKDIFALYLQTTVVLLAIICTDLICLNAAGAGLWTGIVGLFILKSSIKSSKEIADELVGI